MKNTITISQSIYIEATPEVVWNYTQDFNNRMHWDTTIITIEILKNSSPKEVKIKSKGGLQTTLVYKQEHKPNKTSLAMKNTKSIFIKGGGGSWKYQEKDSGTLWQQTNSIILKNSSVHFFLGKYIKKIFEKETQKAMHKAKQIIEQHN